jgi:hypothetical protein
MNMDMHPDRRSEIMASLKACNTADDLMKAWAPLRASGESTDPTIFGYLQDLQRLLRP